MQRVLRWEIPVDDQWHQIGAGYVVEVSARSHRDRPGDLVEVWTLEDTGDTTDTVKLPMREVTIVGTGHPVPDNTEHVGTAIVPAFVVVPALLRGSRETIESRASLVWHVFAKYDPQAERAALAEGAQRLAKIRDAKPTTVEDEATSLAYWLANELGEHIDDQDGETLTQTVQRLLAVKLAPDDAPAVPITDWTDFRVGDVVVQNPAELPPGAADFVVDFLVRRGPANGPKFWTWEAGVPCPDCGQRRVMGYRLDTENGEHMHTHYVCTWWGKGQPKGCGWHGWSVPGWNADENQSDET